MVIVIHLVIVMAAIVFMLRRRLPLGHTMLLAAGLLFILVAPEFSVMKRALERTVTSAGTWKLMAAMYLVMCLEHQLRTTGTFERFMDTVKKVFSDKVLLAVMPGVVGFLPSLGGAIMSCPMVESAAKNLGVTKEQKSTINYWFRHLGEYANPIVPSMLLASEILQVPLKDLLLLIAPFAVPAFLMGWLLLIKTIKPAEGGAVKKAEQAGSPLKNIFMAIGPILFNIFLVIAFNLDAASSLAIVIFVMAIFLKQDLRHIRRMFKGAYNFNLLWGVFGIICFQNMFNTSGAVSQFLFEMEQAAVPIGAVVVIIAFMGGLLCGVGQSVIALAFPIIAAMGSFDMNLVVCAYVFGTAGMMMSPVHLCYPITVDYFHADMVKPMLPVICMEGALMALALLLTQFVFA